MVAPSPGNKALFTANPSPRLASRCSRSVSWLRICRWWWWSIGRSFALLRYVRRLERDVAEGSFW